MAETEIKSINGKTLADITARENKLDKNQGVGNAGKILGIGEDGIVVPQDKPTYTLPQATADALGGIKADAATAEDTQVVRIGTDGKLRTKPTGGSTVTVDDALSSTSVNPVQNKVVTAALAGKITAPTTAAVGQIIKVKSVDDAGKPTEWECADLPSGGGGVVSAVEPADDDIPKVYFTGTLPTSKNDGDVPMKIHYISKTADFVYPATLKVQGSSSASYAKKNFKLKLYEDETYVSKVKLSFKNWGKLNKFVLKAHWVDHSHVRNVGTAKIWGKIVKSRTDYDSLPEELRSAPNNGATDGFTCKVYANGVYQGLYEWIVPKDKLFGQDSDIATHSIVNSELNNQPTCAFATTSPTINGNWSEELQDSMSADIKTSLENLIKFVAGATDEEFVANAETYFDVQSVIDYDIFARVFCIVDNLCRNQIFFTYDGAKWYEGVWDVDSILGLAPLANGSWFAYDTEFQSGYIAYKDYGVTNMLYQRVENLFLDRFKARYAELREGVLSVENIIDVYERLTDVITTYDGLLAEDFASTTGNGAFTGIPHQTDNNIQQIREFVAKRIPYMDEVVENMTNTGGGETVPCTGITLSAETLMFTAEGSQTLTATVTPENTTDTVVWESSDSDIASVSNGVVTAKANGSAKITAKCGEYSAECSVSVSGINETEPPVSDILDNITWHYGSINGITGAPITSKTDIISDAVNIAPYAGTLMGYRVDGATGREGQKVLFFDANGSFISSVYVNTAMGTGTVPENAVTMKCGMLATATKFTVAFGVEEYNLLDFSNEQTGVYYRLEDGSLVSNADYNAQKITVSQSGYLLARVVISGVYFDANDTYISGIAYKSDEKRILEVPENTVSIGFNYRNAEKDGAFVQFFDRLPHGESVVTDIQN